MKGVEKTFGNQATLFSDVSLSLLVGAKIGVLGVNGAGKSTLMKIMAGLDTNYQGEAWTARGVRVGYLDQEPTLDEDKTVFESIMEGLEERKALVDRYSVVCDRMTEEGADIDTLLEEQVRLQAQIEATDSWDLDRKIKVAIDALNCPPGDTTIETLSGGERRRVALCRLLLSQPDLLLLDEPTNHLDAEAVEWLEKYLNDYKGTVVAVTHDRYFLDNVAGWILEIDRGRCLPFEGNYTGWLRSKHRRLELEERTDAALKKSIERELDWIQSSPKARQKKGQARVTNYHNLVESAARYRKYDPNTLIIPNGPRLGNLVFQVDNLSKAYGDHILFKDMTFSAPPGSIIGIVGPNGAGKTTFLRILVGDEVPDKGSFKIGSSVKIGLVAQTRNLNADNRVWEEITGFKDTVALGPGHSIPGRVYVAQFNFKGAAQQKKIKDLSGGERNRVHLAKLLRQGANLLLLDEPTNDLDVDTLRTLETALPDFPGCAVVVSHDRYFLDRVCTHILGFEENGKTYFFSGNYAMYEADKRRRLSGGHNGGSSNSNNNNNNRPRLKKLVA